MIDHLAILLAAMLLDRWVGDPDWLWRKVPHPVVFFGAVITALERRLYSETASSTQQVRRGQGLIAVAVVASLICGVVLASVLDSLGLVGALLEILVVAVFLAQKSLADHVSAVADAFAEGLDAARQSVGMIVGRKTEALDDAGVVRAAIESLAENTSDGVIAPILAYLVLGLPGLLAYKMINTADSMIGHKSPRYRHFGRASARLDDAVNWLPARATAGLAVAAFAIVCGVQDAKRAMRVVLSDHGFHRSPNAGWPEAAFAGGLDVALGGPRVYSGDVAHEPFMNGAGLRTPDIATLRLAIRVFWMICTLSLALVALLWLV